MEQTSTPQETTHDYNYWIVMKDLNPGYKFLSKAESLYLTLGFTLFIVSEEATKDILNMNKHNEQIWNTFQYFNKAEVKSNKTTIIWCIISMG